MTFELDIFFVPGQSWNNFSTTLRGFLPCSQALHGPQVFDRELSLGQLFVQPGDKFLRRVVLGPEREMISSVKLVPERLQLSLWKHFVQVVFLLSQVDVF